MYILVITLRYLFYSFFSYVHVEQLADTKVDCPFGISQPYISTDYMRIIYCVLGINRGRLYIGLLLY